jgi:hypothetical protein
MYMENMVETTPGPIYFPRVNADNFFITYVVGVQIRTAVVLDWVDEHQFPPGWIPWKHMSPGSVDAASGERKWSLIEALVVPTVI